MIEFPLSEDGLDVLSADFDAEKGEWIETNLETSSFNHIYLDGKEICQDDLYRFDVNA